MCVRSFHMKQLKQIKMSLQIISISHAPSFSLTYTWSISFGERDMLFTEEVDRERRIEVVEKR